MRIPATELVDFTLRPRWDHGTATQPKVIYPMIIEKRLEASRSWAEFWENWTRDILGMTAWFWAIPIGQRLYVATKSPKPIQQALIVKKHAHYEGKPNLWHRLTAPFHSEKNILNWDLLSSDSLRHRIKLLSKFEGAEAEKIKPALDFLKQAKLARDSATFLGLVVSFVALGVGVNVYNIYRTKRLVAHEQAEQAQRLSQTA
jgi:hypothetical protein